MTRRQRPGRPVVPARPAPAVRPARPRLPARAGKATPGPSKVPLPSLYAGVDVDNFPGRPPEFLRALAQHSNVDWIAVYLQPAPSSGFGEWKNGRWSNYHGWMKSVPQLRREGFGVTPVWVGEQSPKVTQGGLSMHPSAANGRRDGDAAAELLLSAKLELGTVVYLDLEKISEVEKIEPGVFEYVKAFFERVGARGFRAGLYTPFQMARALAKAWPMISVWVVNGTWRPLMSPPRGDRTTPAVAVDPLRRRQVEVVITKPDLAKSRRWRKPRSFDQDRDDNRLDFPVMWQYLIEHKEPIPVLPAPPGLPAPGPAKWDFSGSLVRDPSFPAGEPRLASIEGRGEVVALGSLEPTRDASGAPIGNGRSGELWLTLSKAPDPAALPPDRGVGQQLHPWARPSVARDPKGGLAVATLLADRRPAVVPVSPGVDSRWTKAEPLPFGSPPLRPLSGVGVATVDGRLCLAGIEAVDRIAGQVLVARQAGDGSWEAPKAMGGPGFRAHPLSSLTVVGRGNDVLDLFVVGVDGRLRNIWWARWDRSWPEAKNIATIGGEGVELHPQTPIAVASTAHSLDVFVFGQDGRLYTTGWQGKGWSPFEALGPDNFRPFPLAQPAAVVRGDKLSTDVFVVDSKGELATLWRPGGRTQWSPGDLRRIGGKAIRPHLFTDIAAHSPTPTSLEVTLVAQDGRPVQTKWSETAGWSDFAPVNLPAFAAPDP